MNHYLLRCCAAAGCVMALSLSSCVDHDYDLAEDIDLTVSLGGEKITIPGSSTADITLAQILDLDGSSSIKKAEYNGQYGLAEGDYVLIQDGSSDPAEFHINQVTLTNHPSNTVRTPLEPFVNLGPGVPVTVSADPTINNIELSDNNVDRALVHLDKATMDVVLSFAIGYESADFTGTIYIKEGYKAIFDPSWTIEIGDAASAGFLRKIDAHSVEFTRDVAISANKPLEASIRLTEIDFTVMNAGQGLYEPGKFRLDSKVESDGDVTMVFDSNRPVGAMVNITLVTKTEIAQAVIKGVTGVVNPEINVDDTSFEIKDVPDFLKSDENRLELENPRINLVVTNTSPLALEVKGILEAVVNGAVSASVKVGSYADGGTDPIIVPAAQTTTIILSRKPVNDPGATNILVPDINDIIRTVPDEIFFKSIDCKAEQKPVTLILGNTYTFDARYEAVIPLAFGENMLLHYTHEDTGWDADLDDYNFDRVEVRLKAINTIPLDMTPAAQALDKTGKVLPTVTATVTGAVRPGQVGSPSTSDLLIELKSTGKNLSELDGISLVFDAKTAGELTGVNLNAGQAVRFEDITITILGGVTIDLNDK